MAVPLPADNWNVSEGTGIDSWARPNGVQLDAHCQNFIEAHEWKKKSNNEFVIMKSKMV